MKRNKISRLGAILMAIVFQWGFPAPSGLRAEAVEQRLAQYQPRMISASSGVAIPYRLYVPVNTGAARLPLVILLHSISERGSDNLQPYRFFLPYLDDGFYKKYPAVIAIPQCPHWHF